MGVHLCCICRSGESCPPCSFLAKYEKRIWKNATHPHFAEFLMECVCVCMRVHACEAKCKENVLRPYKVLPRITISTLAQENGMSRIHGFLLLVGLICSLRNFQMAFSSVSFSRCQKLMERSGIKITAPVVS